jgi:hypothetical protein
LGSRCADLGRVCWWWAGCWRRETRGGARGELFCGFQRREAGGRGGPGVAAGYRPRRLRLKMRFVSDQRWGAASVAVAVAAGGAVGGVGVGEVMVTGCMIARWEMEIVARTVRAA